MPAGTCVETVRARTKGADPIALRPTTIRFAPETFDLLQAEADRVGCPIAQYVREAAIIRLTVDQLERHTGGQVVLADLIRQVRVLARDSEEMDRRASD